MRNVDRGQQPQVRFAATVGEATRAQLFSTPVVHIACSVGLSVLVALSVFHDGVPGFRHDWRFAYGAGALIGSIQVLWQPWSGSGIGSANGYPTFYLSGFTLYLVHWIGTTGIAVLIVMTSIFLAGEGACRYARQVGSGTVGAFAIAAMSTLNPWVYSEEVAGHIFMVLAYGLWFSLIAEFAHPVRRRRLVVLCAVTMSQLEFFAVGIVPLLLALWRRREVQLCAVVAIAALPGAIGILGEYGTIRATPFLLPWQVASSVEPLAALGLRGYSMKYDAAFDTVGWAVYSLAVLSIVGLVSALRETLPRALCIVAVACFVLCTGVHGPLGLAYAWIVLNVPESGLFRELYDLVAVIALAYCIGMAHICRRLHWIEPVVAALALALIVPWITSPVAAHTVPLRSFQPTPIPAVTTERVAFLPAFQPVSLKGMGSGFDPDIVPRVGHAMSLNEFLPQYPVDRVLAQLENDGADAPASSLGVAEVLVRPEFLTDRRSLALQATYVVPRPHPNRTHHVANPWSIIGIVPKPTIASVVDDPREDAIAFADVGSPFNGIASEMLPEPDRRISDSRQGWIDARLTVDSHPRWATASGGIYTSSTVLLRLPKARRVLGAAAGKLVDQKGVVIAADPNLLWRPLPRSSVAIRCEGTCVVAAFGDPPHGLPEHGPYDVPSPRLWKWITPWFVAVTLNGHENGALRFAVRYNQWWVALDGPAILRHVRLASALNGWVLPEHHGKRVVLIDVLAALQIFAEIVAVVVILICTCRRTRAIIVSKAIRSTEGIELERR